MHCSVKTILLAYYGPIDLRIGKLWSAVERVLIKHPDTLPTHLNPTELSPILESELGRVPWCAGLADSGARPTGLPISV